MINNQTADKRRKRKDGSEGRPELSRNARLKPSGGYQVTMPGNDWNMRVRLSSALNRIR